MDESVTTSTQDANIQGFRLSLQQKNLWSLQQAAGEQPFRAVCAVEIHGNLRPDLLQQSLQHIVERHEILRTTFQRPPGIKTPFQVVSPLSQCSWQVMDISRLAAADQRDKIEECFTQELERPVDLERGPLLRATLIQQAGERHVLLLSLPTICADSRTIANVITELAGAYDLALNGRALSGEPLQYADFAQWQHELLEGDDEQASSGKAYWNDMASAAVPAPGLPLRKRGPGTPTFQEGTEDIPLDAVLCSRIESTAQAHGTSVSAVLFACWQALFWRLAGQPESAFAIHRFCDGRKLEDLQAALGLYAKYLPIRCCCRDERFIDHLRGVVDALGKADEWQEYVDLGPSPDSTVSFDFEDRPLTFESGGLSFSRLKQHVSLGPFTLKLSCVRSGDALSAELLYNRHVLDREVVARFAGYFERFLSAVLEDPETTLGDVEILSDEERAHLLFELNQTGAEFPRDKCIHQLFEEQAARTPEAIAVVSGPHELTYRELNVRANQLAYLLRRRGVKPNVPVGLSVGRSVEMIVGLLGILKAGARYVPLNPEHPPARLALQLTESRAPILVTNGDAVEPLPGFSGETIDLGRDRALLEAEPTDQSAGSRGSREPCVCDLHVRFHRRSQGCRCPASESRQLHAFYSAAPAD